MSTWPPSRTALGVAGTWFSSTTPGTIGEGSTDASSTPLLHGCGESGARPFLRRGIATAGAHGAAWTVGLNQRPNQGFGFHHGRLPERGPPYLVAAAIGVPMARTLPDPRPTAGLKDPVLLEHDGVVVCEKPPGLPSSGRDPRRPVEPSGPADGPPKSRQGSGGPPAGPTDQRSLNVFVLQPRVAEAAAWLQDGTKTYSPWSRAGCSTLWRSPRPSVGSTRGRRVAALTPTGRPARSSVVPLAVGKDASLVSVRLHTAGRTHQARLHLAHLGHPLLGERLHAPAPCRRHPRHALHAWRLDLPAALHPAVPRGTASVRPAESAVRRAVFGCRTAQLLGVTTHHAAALSAARGFPGTPANALQPGRLGAGREFRRPARDPVVRHPVRYTGEPGGTMRVPCKAPPWCSSRCRPRVAAPRCAAREPGPRVQPAQRAGPVCLDGASGG